MSGKFDADQESPNAVVIQLSLQRRHKRKPSNKWQRKIVNKARKINVFAKKVMSY